MSLKNFIKSKPLLVYFFKCYKGIKDRNLRAKIVNIDNDPYVATIVHKGNKNVGMPIYYINVGSPTIGFFALLRIVLDALAYADYFGLVPYVKYKECVSYQEQYKINGTKNSFEYYFQLNSKISDIEESAFVVQCEQAHFVNAIELHGYKKVNDYLISDAYYEFYAKIFKKYISINENVKRRMENDLKRVKLPEKYIGVHYRGTDFKNNYGNHPVSMGVDDYVDEIEGLIKQYDYPIFLATDDLAALDFLKKKFGSRIMYFDDVVRGDNNLSVICKEEDRKDHHFLLGYEVLRDMYTLSKADIFVSGLSQVSMFTEIYKRANSSNFEKHIVISKGINKNSKTHVTDINKYRKRK